MSLLSVQQTQNQFALLQSQLQQLLQGMPTTALTTTNGGGHPFFDTVFPMLERFKSLINRPPISFPNPVDSSHPQGSLRVEGNAVVTAGGYRIEQLGQFEWKITDPNGKDSTRIWGDPHVDESDRDGAADWDFKRDSTFVLGDGTRINVSTAPWSGNKNMTITTGLEIISGNDRVVVSGIDKGRGNIGSVTQDGYQHVNSFAGKDVFVMGDNAADWTHQGREIISSNNGGDSLNLGNAMQPGGNIRFQNDMMMYQMMKLMQQMLSLMQQMLGRMEKSPGRLPLETADVPVRAIPKFRNPVFNARQFMQGIPALNQALDTFGSQVNLNADFNRIRNVTINNFIA